LIMSRRVIYEPSAGGAVKEYTSFADLSAALDSAANGTIAQLNGATSGNRAGLFKRFGASDYRAEGLFDFRVLGGSELSGGTDYTVAGAALSLSDLEFASGLRNKGKTGTVLLPFLGSSPGQMSLILARVDIGVGSPVSGDGFGIASAYNSSASLWGGAAARSGTKWYRANVTGTPALIVWGPSASPSWEISATNGQEFLILRQSFTFSAALDLGNGVVGPYGSDRNNSGLKTATGLSQPGVAHSDHIPCLVLQSTVAAELTVRLLTIQFVAEDL
jgi:hypothetical protein